MVGEGESLRHRFRNRPDNLLENLLAGYFSRNLFFRSILPIFSQNFHKIYSEHFRNSLSAAKKCSLSHPNFLQFLYIFKLFPVPSLTRFPTLLKFSTNFLKILYRFENLMKIAQNFSCSFFKILSQLK